jgi:hypothetical protein
MDKIVEPKPTRKMKISSQYRIVVEGEINKSWFEWLGEVSIEKMDRGHGTRHTIICGFVPDQAALRGLLIKIWDLNLTLVSVNLQEIESYGGNNEY